MYWKAVGPHRFKLNNLFNVGGKYIYLEENQSPMQKAVCAESVQNLLKSAVSIVSLLFISLCVYTIGPLHECLFQNHLVTPLGTRLPCIDSDSNVGFALNMFQQCICTTYAATAYFSLEIGQCLINNVITTIPKLIHVDLVEMSNELQTNGMSLESINYFVF